MTTSTHARLTQDDIEAGYANDEWLGWGYLGERQTYCVTSTGRRRVATADRALLAHANDNLWTAETLFDWLNSKLGRWYGDSVFGTDEPARAAALRALSTELGLPVAVFEANHR